MSIPIIIGADANKRVEIARSFSYKLNLGRFNPQLQYESMDFFASQKCECALADAEEVSQKLYDFCKSEVLKAVRESINKIMEAKTGRKVA